MRRLALLALACAAAPAPAPARTIFDEPGMTTVMSFNLRVAVDEGERAWTARAPRAAAIVRRYRPLFLGTQEGLGRQVADLRALLPGYAHIGGSRRGAADDEHSAIFYDADRAELLAHGDLWLSLTPGLPGSTLPGVGTPRMASWGRFRLRNRHEVYVFNTHLALEPENSAAQARILVGQIERIVPAGAEAILTGDLNSTPDSATWAILRGAGFAEARMLAPEHFGPAFSFHDWKGADARREATLIDAIFIRAAEPPSRLIAGIVADQPGEPPVSDHFPVLLTDRGDARLSMGPPIASTARTKANRAFDVDVPVRNLGERGIVPVRIRDDGTLVAEQWLVLEAGERSTARFRLSLPVPGFRRLSTGSGPATTVIVDRVPATIRTEALDASAYVTIGETFAVVATLRNLGSDPGVADAALTVDGVRQAARPLRLGSGERRDLAFTARLEASGLHRLAVGDRSVEVGALRPFGGGWQLHRGDDAGCAAVPTDRCTWEAVAVPEPWEKAGYLTDRVHGWYRTDIVVPAEWRGRAVRFVLGRIDDADTSFLNGRRIGATGRMPGDPQGFASGWNVTRSYDVPPEAIRYGAENLLTIRVYDDTGGGGMFGGPIGMLPLP